MVLDDQPAEDAAKAAKQLWKSKPGMDLRITKARKPEWLAQNLDNPFRGWDGAEHIPATAAKKAANQYRKTRALLMKLAAEPGGDAQAQALDAVVAYTQTFNQMGFIETAANQYRKTRALLMKLAAEPGGDARPRRWMRWWPTPRPSTRWASLKPRSGMKFTWPCGVSWMPCRAIRSRKMP